RPVRKRRTSPRPSGEFPSPERLRRRRDACRQDEQLSTQQPPYVLRQATPRMGRASGLVIVCCSIHPGCVGERGHREPSLCTRAILARFGDVGHSRRRSMELCRPRNVHVAMAKRVTQPDITRDRRPRAALAYGDLLLLILLGVVTRAVLWSNYQPQIYP